MMNSLMVAVLFVQLWLATVLWTQDRGVGLFRWLGWPVELELVLAILVLDGWMYVWHRLNHGVGFLWRFHRVHHSELQMDVTSANRFHFGEIAISGFLRIPLIVLLGLSFGQLLAYETALFVVVQFHHANIRLPAAIERVLSRVIVTPGIHRIHHSDWQPETNSNYASLFSFWDRLFGTRRHHDPERKSKLGLAEFPDAATHTLAGMMEQPLGSTRRAVN